MLSSQKKRLIISVAVLFLVFLILFWPEECLTAKCGNELLFAWPIRAGESFEVTFTHSLNLSPITDVIEWSGYDMIVRKSVFKAFGAGVPVPSDGIGTELISVDGHYELIGIDKHMQNFSIMTQTLPNHHVTLNGREAFLLELVASGKSVDIAVKSVPRAARAVAFIRYWKS